MHWAQHQEHCSVFALVCHYFIFLWPKRAQASVVSFSECQLPNLSIRQASFSVQSTTNTQNFLQMKCLIQNLRESLQNLITLNIVNFILQKEIEIPCSKTFLCHHVRNILLMKLRGGTFSWQNKMRVLRKKQTHVYYHESLYNSVLQKLAALFCTKHNAWQFASLPLLIFFPVHSRETRIRLDFKQLVQCYTLNQS